jgi:hypothetical protein
MMIWALPRVTGNGRYRLGRTRRPAPRNGCLGCGGRARSRTPRAKKFKRHGHRVPPSRLRTAAPPACRASAPRCIGSSQRRLPNANPAARMRRVFTQLRVGQPPREPQALWMLLRCTECVKFLAQLVPFLRRAKFAGREAGRDSQPRLPPEGRGARALGRCCNARAGGTSGRRGRRRRPAGVDRPRAWPQNNSRSAAWRVKFRTLRAVPRRPSVTKVPSLPCRTC